LREPGAHGIRQVVDVGGGPGEQIARTRPLDHAQGEVEDSGDELLTQAGQHPLPRMAPSPRLTPVSTVWTTRAPAKMAMAVSIRPAAPLLVVLLMTSSSTFGPTRPAALATPCKARTTMTERRCSLIRRRT